MRSERAERRGSYEPDRDELPGKVSASGGSRLKGEGRGGGDTAKSQGKVAAKDKRINRALLLCPAASLRRHRTHSNGTAGGLFGMKRAF